ncbi:ABC transporter permease [Anaerolineales bacterium HSG24]|nr:ABC transporter permease [Anaerolineales bacterium HSG24]
MTDVHTITAQNNRAKGQDLNPLHLGRTLWQHRALIHQFTKRQVAERYKGSYLGLIWSFVTPLVMLLVYTFVFSVIFQARWSHTITGSYAEFALTLFTGLIAFNLFSETVIIAPTLIINNPNFVKRVVFPLEILPVSSLGSALVNSGISLIILLAGTIIVLNQLAWTIIFLPFVYLPLVLLVLGLSWFLASLGVFIRDIGHLLNVLMQMLFFLTPIFYPISAVPESIQFILYLNPLTFIVTHFRRVILWQQLPDWGQLFIITGASLLICLLGYSWFMRSKKTFADIV